MIRLSLGLSGSKVWRRFISMNGMPYMWDKGDIWPGYDQKHRANGPAVVYPDGTLEYWVNDQLHRLDGPAVTTANGVRGFWVNDQRHRSGGPAVIWPDGTLEYWLNGNPVSEYEQIFLDSTHI